MATFAARRLQPMIANVAHILAIELLAAIPSIVYGMWGLLVFAPILSKWVQQPLQAVLGDVAAKGVMSPDLYNSFGAMHGTIMVFLAIVPLFFVLKNMGLLNTLPGLICVYVAFALPFTVFFLYAFFQGLPEEIAEAAAIDGATGFTQFRKIVFPLLMVATAPLLVSSFAFNFNNFNAIQLLTAGGPFSPDNPAAGGTDILVSYTYRLAFGGVGEQIGFASAVSVILFLLTAVIAAVQFRGTRKLEEIY